MGTEYDKYKIDHTANVKKVYLWIERYIPWWIMKKKYTITGCIEIFNTNGVYTNSEIIGWPIKDSNGMIIAHINGIKDGQWTAIPTRAGYYMLREIIENHQTLFINV